MKTLLLLTCFAVTISGKLMDGIDTIQMNYDLSFEKSIVTKNLLGTDNSPMIRERPLYSNEIDLKNIDLSVISINQFCTCIYEVFENVFASPRPFYVSKKNCNEIDITGVLKLQDTSTFIKIDTSWKGSPYIFDDSIVRIPHELIGFGHYYVFQTRDSHYALLRIIGSTYSTPQYPKESPMYDPREIYLTSVIINWFLQTDGTANFLGVKMSSGSGKAIHQVRKDFTTNYPEIMNTQSYTLDGQVLKYSSDIYKPSIRISYNRFGKKLTINNNY